MAAMESSAPVLQLHGEKEGTESGVEKLKNGGKYAAAATAWEGGMKNLRDVYPGIVHQEEESSSPATTAVGTQLSENAEEESVVKKSHGSDGTTQGVFTESGQEDQRTSDLNEMLHHYEQEVGKSLRLCEQQPVPPPEDDATNNPTTTTTTTTTTENQSKERLGGPAADLLDLGSTSVDGAKEEEGSPRPGLIKSLVGTKIVPLVAPLVTPLVSVVTVVGESTAAVRKTPPPPLWVTELILAGTFRELHGLSFLLLSSDSFVVSCCMLRNIVFGSVRVVNFIHDSEC